MYKKACVQQSVVWVQDAYRTMLNKAPLNYLNIDTAYFLVQHADYADNPACISYRKLNTTTNSPED
jgi:hypothetical protein